MNIPGNLAFNTSRIAGEMYKKLQESDSNNINCPLCGCESLEYHHQGDTHMYVCSECPFVGFEHWDYNNVLDILDRYFGLLENCNKDTLMTKLLHLQCELKKGNNQ